MAQDPLGVMPRLRIRFDDEGFAPNCVIRFLLVAGQVRCTCCTMALVAALLCCCVLGIADSPSLRTHADVLLISRARLLTPSTRGKVSTPLT